MEWTEQEIEKLVNIRNVLAKVKVPQKTKRSYAAGLDEWPLRVKRLVDKIDVTSRNIDLVCRDVIGKQPRACYSFIPFHNVGFILDLLKVMQHHNKHHPSRRKLRFLDAGCGPGLKVVIAEAMGCMATGLEISPTLIKKGKELFSFNRRHPRLRQGDVRFHDYGEYDIIFFYAPLRSSTQEKIFEKRIWEQCRVGAYVIGRMQAIRPPHKYIDIGKCEGKIWFIYRRTRA